MLAAMSAQPTTKHLIISALLWAKHIELPNASLLQSVITSALSRGPLTAAAASLSVCHGLSVGLGGLSRTRRPRRPGSRLRPAISVLIPRCRVPAQSISRCNGLMSSLRPRTVLILSEIRDGQFLFRTAVH